ncbi:hypothetical protein [Veillonella sp. VA139]|uniref:hypothetical protein n=1 Tax=Veillonella sp. VA139 TaxID=741830 RepID=UPI000F8D59FB|nr:hypothetical protein [Veillonella sp. VA139]
MNWMNDGENRNNTNPINFKPIDVDYNISLADAIKLSAEKSGYEAEIIKNNNATQLNIKIPFLVGNEEDGVNVYIGSNIYSVYMNIGIRRPNTLEEKLELLEYVNDNNDFVSFYWVNTDKLCFISIDRRCWRMDVVDRSLEWGWINIDFGNAQIHDNEELVEETSALRERLSVYMDENLEFNMSGKWNATHGYEYGYILDDINNLIRVVQAERENILRFT